MEWDLDWDYKPPLLNTEVSLITVSIIDAIEIGDIKTLEKCIVNKMPFDSGCLGLAARGGNHPVVFFLLENIFTGSKHKIHAFAEAISIADYPLAARLLKRYPDMDLDSISETKNGFGIQSFAIESCNRGLIDIIKSLLKISWLKFDNKFLTPLNTAISHGHSEIVREILNDSKTRVDLRSSFTSAVDSGNEAIVAAFLDCPRKLNMGSISISRTSNQLIRSRFLADPRFIKSWGRNESDGDLCYDSKNNAETALISAMKGQTLEYYKDFIARYRYKFVRSIDFDSLILREDFINASPDVVKFTFSAFSENSRHSPSNVLKVLKNAQQQKGWVFMYTNTKHNFDGLEHSLKGFASDPRHRALAVEFEVAIATIVYKSIAAGFHRIKKGNDKMSRFLSVFKQVPEEIRLSLISHMYGCDHVFVRPEKNKEAKEWFVLWFIDRINYK